MFYCRAPGCISRGAAGVRGVAIFNIMSYVAQSFAAG